MDDRVTVTLDIPDETLVLLTQEAERRDILISALVGEILTDYCEQFDDEGNLK